MRGLTWAIALGLVLSLPQLNVAQAIEYNEPQPVQKFPGSGLLISSGNDHGVEFKAFLETKRLLVAPDAIYYVAVERVETTEQGTPGKINWDIRARCAVRPDLAGKLAIGVYSSSRISSTEQFTEVDPKASEVPNNASRGWYAVWWAACRGTVKKFQ
jgi:hypothetical protein